MLEARLQHPTRAPSACCIGAGILTGYQVRFHKIGRDGSGKCNALATGNLDDAVYGVVFQIAERDAKALDELEDVPRGGYSRKQVETVAMNCADKNDVDCYFANSEFIDDKLLPFDWYKAIVVAGALEHDLPQEYVRSLREHPSLDDSDRERSERSISLLGPWRALALSDQATDGSNSQS